MITAFSYSPGNLAKIPVKSFEYNPHFFLTKFFWLLNMNLQNYPINIPALPKRPNNFFQEFFKNLLYILKNISSRAQNSFRLGSNVLQNLSRSLLVFQKKNVEPGSDNQDLSQKFSRFISEVLY